MRILDVRYIAVIFMSAFLSCTERNAVGAKSAALDVDWVVEVRDRLRMEGKIHGNDKAISLIDSLEASVGNPTPDMVFFLELLRLEHDESLSTFEKLEKCLDFVNSQAYFGVDYLNRVFVHDLLHVCLIDIGSHKEALNQVEMAVKLIEHDKEQYGKQLGSLYFLVGRIAYKCFGDTEKCIASLSKSLEIANSYGYHYLAYRAYTILASIECKSKRYQECSSYTRNAEMEFRRSQLFDENELCAAIYAKQITTLYSLSARFPEEQSYKDSIRRYFEVCDKLHDFGRLTASQYTKFQKYTINSLIQIGDYEKARNTISELECHFMENKDGHCYDLALLNMSKYVMERTVGTPASYREALVNAFEHMETCGDPPREDYGIMRSNVLIYLEKMDTTSNNFEGAYKWAKSGLYKIDKHEALVEAQLKQSQFWMDREMAHAKRTASYNEAKYYETRDMLILVMLFTFFILLLAIFLYYITVERKKQNQVISIKNLEIEEMFVELKESSETIKHKNDELEKLINELKESNESLEHFAHIAAHDLKGPLRNISGFTGIIAGKYSSIIAEDDKQMFDFVLEGVKDLVELINGLLNFSSVSGEQSEPVEVDLQEVMKSVEAKLKDSIAENAVRLFIPEEHCTIKAHKSIMVQLFLNLVSNAIKFRKPDVPPEIAITYEKYDENYLLVKVSDNGIGIDPAHHKEIFDRFKKLHSPETYKGSGIGLSTCKKIVNKYGGDIWVESELGRGTTFYFTLRRASRD